MRAAEALIVFVLVAGSHFTYEYLSQGDFFYPDSFTYLTPALNLLHGHGFSTEGDPETMRTPSYPLFLLPFLAAKAPAGVIVAANHLLDALLAACVYLLARRNGARRWIAFAASLVLGLDLISIHYANKILTETLSAVLVFAIFVIVLHRRSMGWLTFAGFLCGALVLTRPVAIAFFAVIAAWLWWQRVPKIAIAGFVVASLALTIGWASRNAQKTGVFTVSTIGSNNLLMYRAAGALAAEDGGNFPERLEARQAEMQVKVEEAIREGEGVDDPEELTTADTAKYYSGLAKPILLHHPRGVMLVTLRGFYMNMFDTDWDALAEVVDDELIEEEWTERAVIAWTWALWIATLAGLAVMWRGDRAQAVLIAATIFYFLFMAAGGEAEARFRIPVIPLMALAAAAAGSSKFELRSSN